MTTKNKKMYEQCVKSLEEKFNRKMTVNELKQIKERFGNKVVHHIDLRQGEVDIRKLSEEDYRQVNDRNVRDLLAYDKIMVQLLSDITCYLGVIAGKLGVQDIKKAVDEFNEKMIKGE